ncbi:hypothetical protein NQT69_18505 [Pseudoalteromonas shioyasakiensis]|uniref:hypothetical protein n=1 Tax=Pseudoalteromonas shioyasakiensis TaxID=1190813 RepID=UPI0021193E1F|nr:hypothetical protein [Pseudoalteromonas shioyasakiensis]MCQ8879993.1 hypothetical protein [Pseudoalteromonas shioyasakiensis]
MPLIAHAAMPKSEILLAKTNTEYGLQVSRITEGNSYNNQPLLTDNGIYFTQEVNELGQSQTDLAFYSFDEQQTYNLTNSPVSEYSATLKPAGDALSAIVVEADGKQKLWQYPLNAELSPSRIFEWIEPVGYHAWGRDNDLVMFILGEPHTLQYTTVVAAKGQVVAKHIGRTLTFNPTLAAFTFTYTKNEQNWLASFAPNSQMVTDLFRLPDTVQDYAFKNDNTVIYALDNRIYQRSLSEPQRVSQWLDLTPYCSTAITRLSYNNEQLAFVCRK